MQADKRTSEVEDFRLTAHQKAFQKAFRQMAGIRKVIEAEGIKEATKLRNITDIYRSFMRDYEEFYQSMPRDQVKEIPGMNFPMPDEEGFEEKPQTPELSY